MRLSRQAILLAALAGTALGGWLPEERLTERVTEQDKTTFNNARAVASDRDGNLHVVWYGDHLGEWQIWYSRWDAATQLWSEDTVISDDSIGAVLPAIAVDDSGNAHVVWQAGRENNGLALRYCRRTPYGHWDSLETVRVGTHVERPSIAAWRPGFVAAAWEEQCSLGRKAIVVRTRSSSGWAEPETLTRPEAVNNVVPSIGVDASDNIGVVWRWANVVGGRIVSRWCTGGHWDSIVSLQYLHDTSDVNLWVDRTGAGHVLLLVRDSAGSPVKQIAYRQRTSSGWLDSVVLPRAARIQKCVSVCSDDQRRIHATWLAEIGTSGVPQICHAYADSTGREWSAPETVTVAPEGRSAASAAPMADGHLAVTWTDLRHNRTYPDIYLRRTGCFHDIGVLGIEGAVGVIDSGSVFSPTGVVRNFGEVTDTSVAVWLTIDDSSEYALIPGIDPGDTARGQFPARAATSRGWHAVACSVAHWLDMDSTNDVVHDSFLVRVADAAVESIVSPLQGLEHPATESLPLRARVSDRGTDSARFFCLFRVEDTATVVFRDSVFLVLAPGESREQVFDTLLFDSGDYTATCSTMLADDMNRVNDIAAVGFRVLPVRIEFGDLFEPVADSGETLSPGLRVDNTGGVRVGCSLRLTIDTGYADTQYVEVGPDSVVAVTFAGWLPGRRGLHPFRCTTGHAVPRLPEYPAVSGSIRVRVRDVGVEAIQVPKPDTTYARGAVIVPQARLGNPGTDTAEFVVRLRMVRDGEPNYSDSVRARLAPGAFGDATFRACTLSATGSHLAVCSTGLAGDMVPGNDVDSVRFEVGEHDVGVELLVPLPESVDLGSEHSAAVRLANNGTFEACCSLVLEVEPAFADTDTVHIPAGGSRDWNSRPWPADSAGGHRWRMTVFRPGQGPVEFPGEVFVRLRDVAVFEVLAPDTVVEPEPVEPEVRVGNPGNVAWQGIGRIRIGSGYQDSVRLSLAPAADTVVAFAIWQAEPGSHELRVELDWQDDIRPENNVETRRVRVKPVYPGPWLRLADLPSGTRGRRVRAGGGLVAEAGRLFALKGTNTNDWYGFEPAGDSWQALAEVPAGPSGRRVRDGSALAADGHGRVYLLKGNRTRELFHYDANGDSWVELAALPSMLKPPRKGTAATFVAGDTDRVLVVLGNGTSMFLAYWVGPDQWHALRPVPPGPRGRKPKHGTALAELGGRVFLLKGGTDEFYEYFPDGDTWAARASLPATTGGRQARKGASLASDGGRLVYALKGKGNQFWCYQADADTWVRLEDVPAGPRNRRVNQGAGLAAINGRVYLLKAGGCPEFWRYDSQARAGRSPRSGVAATDWPVPAEPVFEVRQGAGRLIVLGPAADLVRLRVFDCVGREVRAGISFEPGRVLLGSLRPGVYFIAAESRVLKATVLR